MIELRGLVFFSQLKKVPIILVHIEYSNSISLIEKERAEWIYFYDPCCRFGSIVRKNCFLNENLDLLVHNYENYGKIMSDKKRVHSFMF